MRKRGGTLGAHRSGPRHPCLASLVTSLVAVAAAAVLVPGALAVGLTLSLPDKAPNPYAYAFIIRT